MTNVQEEDEDDEGEEEKNETEMTKTVKMTEKKRTIQIVTRYIMLPKGVAAHNACSIKPFEQHMCVNTATIANDFATGDIMLNRVVQFTIIFHHSPSFGS